MDRTPEAENVTPVPTAPPTPGTPGGPLFSSIRVDSLSYDRKSMPHCKCFAVGHWTPNHTCFTDFPKPTVSLTKKLGDEFVGTFLLIFFATAAPIMNEKYDHAETLIGNAGSAGLAVMIIILSTGHISGAHLNPAVTLGFSSFRHFPWMHVQGSQTRESTWTREGRGKLVNSCDSTIWNREFDYPVHIPAYIAAQVSGSICACFLLKAVFHPFMHGGVTVPAVSVWQAFLLEFIITFNLMFVVTAVATDTRAVGELAGIAVGATVMLNILIAGPGTGGAMNPVRALGPAIAAGNYKGIWIYLVAPPVGAVLDAATYSTVRLRDDEVDPPRQVRSFRR